MNIENILMVAEHLENLPEEQQFAKMSDLEGFNLNQWTHSCGTPSCIAGYAGWFMFGKPEIVLNEYYKVNVSWTDIAEKFFGLEGMTADRKYMGETETVSLARKLCVPSVFDPEVIDCGADVYNFKAKQVAKVLRHLAATGEVDYRVGIEPVQSDNSTSE